MNECVVLLQQRLNRQSLQISHLTLYNVVASSAEFKSQFSWQSILTKIEFHAGRHHHQEAIKDNSDNNNHVDSINRQKREMIGLASFSHIFSFSCCCSSQFAAAEET